MTTLIDSIKQDNFCALPWLNSEIRLKGDTVTATPCCKFKGDSEIANNLKTIWFGKKYQDLRQRFIDGDPVPECSACDVAPGQFSYKKMNHAQYLRESVLQNTLTEEPKLPHSLRISLSSVCNLACRMCDTGASTTLDNLIRKSTILQELSPLRGEENHPLNLNVLGDSLKNIYKINIAGGEPLVDKDCILLLEYIFKESSNLRLISFSTNLTKLNTQILNFLDKFDCHIKFNVSIDGPEQINDYIRHGSNFNTIIENIKYIHERYPKITFGVNSTVSSLNVGYVLETLDTLHKIEQITRVKFSHIMTSPVLTPTFLHPRNIPENTKKFYFNKLSAISEKKYSIHHSNELVQTAVSLMKGEFSPEEYDKFKRYITEFDKLVNTDFESLYPEFSI
jgi:sulfatase maturation enzyme AslB (radical SAM superfamily)